VKLVTLVLLIITCSQPSIAKELEVKLHTGSHSLYMEVAEQVLDSVHFTLGSEPFKM
jgi:hypothetical protein